MRWRRRFTTTACWPCSTARARARSRRCSTTAPPWAPSAENILGNLVASNAGPAYGVGGLGTIGTGAGGGGEHEGTIGIGSRSERSATSAVGPARVPTTESGVGALHGRQAHVPDPDDWPRERARHAGQGDHPAHRPPASQRGEVLLPAGARRAVRRWRGASSPSSPSRRPDGCWRRSSRARRCGRCRSKRASSTPSSAGSFPQPERGGLAMVSYPFTFAPAGD